MVAYWRQAGLSYIRYSAVCARVVRAALKPQLRVEAERIAETNVKVNKIKTIKMFVKLFASLKEVGNFERNMKDLSLKATFLDSWS